ncbi:tumor necrosis factor receptor superfamily member 27 isoform X15 [Homo sapiens]|uniref:tumor necrosis factor receptor superfamily member 27 isoform X15 n=1 Tax=Homo sapiens TaxID=9606 RepID=UPI0023DE8576|nr:tumor necrosis factor receptor superfamily member 27 isoform X15 [Homo sapiens]XP_054183473.1 tumor necrosis factor receptor superfamily member 27 isoform X15 [Homo sapiens]
MDCQENEYWDQWGRCVTCQRCGPGQELSKDCGYGEGGDAYCTACPPRRYKSSWGHHKCQSCITCAVINRVQKVNCTATSNAVCGDCLPRFYRKTRIGGLQDQECIPCTKQTPTSEVQCAFQLSLVEADAPTVPPQEATLVALLQEVCCSLRLIKQQRRNLSSPCHPARRPVLSPKSLGPLAALPSCSLWTLFLYHNSSRGLKCDVHKS